MLKLVEQALVGQEKNRIVVKYRKKVSFPYDKQIYSTLHLLKTGMSEEKIREMKFPLKYLDILIKNHLIYDYKGKYKNTPVEKQEYFLSQFGNAEVLQKKLDQSSILVLGVGGIGSVIIENLVGLGIKNFVLIDADKVEISNFNRQFIYFPKDIGKPKVDIAKKYILYKNKEAKIKTYNQFISCQKDIANILEKNKVDIIINAADTPKDIEKILYDSVQKIPIISGGVGFDLGNIKLLTEKNKTNTSNSELKVLEYPSQTVASLSFTNTIIASLMALKAFQIITKIDAFSEKNISIDFKNLKIYNN